MHKHTVLIVEDETELLEFYGLILEADFNVIALSNPLEAMDAMANNKIDIVVSDISMPQINGRDLVLAIKNQYPLIKALGISAHHHSVERNHMFDLYLQKPLVSLEKLNEAVKELISQTLLTK